MFIIDFVRKYYFRTPRKTSLCAFMSVNISAGFQYDKLELCRNMNLFPNKNILENILCGCCTILAFVLIFLEFRTFIAKPTSTEQTTTGLTFRLAPQADWNTPMV